MIEKKVMAAISSHQLAEKGDKVLVGLSGGPDSLCLFWNLCGMADDLGIEVCAVHVNHGLRGEAADADEAFVKALCEERQIRCFTYRADCLGRAKSTGESSEEAGRNLRYECFSDAARKLAEDGSRVKIAVAHNADDQAETVLLRLLRGTGTDGLAGMDYRRSTGDGFEIIRPLLDVSRSEIEEYCREKGLEARRDATNGEAVFTRNKVRLELLPYLEDKYNPRIKEALVRLAKSAGEDKACLEALTAEAFEALLQSVTEDCVSLRKQDFLKLAPALKHRLIPYAFAKIGLTQDISAVHMDAADRLLAVNRTGSRTDFPHGYYLLIKRSEIHFLKGEIFKRVKD